jgi:hypothetical protein
LRLFSGCRADANRRPRRQGIGHGQNRHESGSPVSWQAPIRCNGIRQDEKRHRLPTHRQRGGGGRRARRQVGCSNLVGCYFRFGLFYPMIRRESRMSRFSRIFAVGTVLWTLVFVLLGVSFTNGESNAYLLDGREMRQVAKGATQAPCTDGLSSGTCGDDSGTCGRISDPTDCKNAGACGSCTKGLVGEQVCLGPKPWTVQNCQQIPDIPQNGCGLKYANTVCVFNQVSNKCECLNGKKTNDPCFRWSATFISPCAVVPK